MHLLVTRPQPDAGQLAARLEAMGHEATCAPLMHIRQRTGARPDLSDIQALAFTSANGVRAFAALSAMRDRPAFAVGAATAEAARAAGFADVRMAGGDVASLARRIAADLDPRTGAVLHGAGRHVAGDLAAALSAAGFEVRRETLYEAEAAAALPAAAVRAMRGEPSALHGILFFSPRSAKLFEKLACEAGFAARLGALTAYCLSPAVAAVLTNDHWQRIAAAAAPDQISLLALLPPSTAQSAGKEPF